MNLTGNPTHPDKCDIKGVERAEGTPLVARLQTKGQCRSTARREHKPRANSRESPLAETAIVNTRSTGQCPAGVLLTDKLSLACISRRYLLISPLTSAWSAAMRQRPAPWPCARARAVAMARRGGERSGAPRGRASWYLRRRCGGWHLPGIELRRDSWPQLLNDDCLDLSDDIDANSV